MLFQLPEEKKDLIFPLFKNRQPNRSAPGCYFNGTMPGKAFVDDLNAPAKAICRLDMSWTYISDGADFPWIEETLHELIKTDWLQVIWVPERKEPLQKPRDGENTESVRLAEKLGFVNPVAYDFIFFAQKKETAAGLSVVQPV